MGSIELVELSFAMGKATTKKSATFEAEVTAAKNKYTTFTDPKSGATYTKTNIQVDQSGLPVETVKKATYTKGQTEYDNVSADKVAETF